MGRFRKIHFVAWSVFVATFLPGVGGLGENVLCFGADGHIAVEAAVSPGACFSASGGANASADPLEPELASKGDHCGPCADFPVLVGSADRASPSGSLRCAGPPGPFALAVGASAVRQEADDLSLRARSGFRSLLSSPTSVSLRTTVLLI